MGDRDSTNTSPRQAAVPVRAERIRTRRDPTEPAQIHLPPTRPRLDARGRLAIRHHFPLVVLGIELAANWCEEVLFDPLPSGVHVFLVALVPIANLLAQSREASIRFSWVQRALNGAALVVALVYSLVFLPLAAAVRSGSVALRHGLLSMSPMFALFATLVARRLIANRAIFDPPPRFKPRLLGALAAAALFIGAALPHLVTQYGLRLADSTDIATAQKAASSCAASDRRFPGKVAHFRSGSTRYVFRFLAEPTRILHPAQHCYRASGYDTGPEHSWFPRRRATLRLFHGTPRQPDDIRQRAHLRRKRRHPGPTFQRGTGPPCSDAHRDRGG